MAFPPLNIDEAVPGDSDVVSLFPAAERTFRNDLEDFLLVDHNVQGRHNTVRFDWIADPSGTASVTTLWADTAGELNYRIGTGAVAALLPPGMVVPFAGSTAPEGWLLCAGQAVSRTTYAALFAAIGTTYGVGDGSTTFNLPDLRGRLPYGKDNMTGSDAARLTTAGGGIDGDTLGATGGQQSRTLVQANLPNINLTSDSRGQTETGQANNVFMDPFSGITGIFNNAGNPGSAQAAAGSGQSRDRRHLGISFSWAHSHTVPLGGSDTPLQTTQPGVVLNYIIKW